MKPLLKCHIKTADGGKTALLGDTGHIGFMTGHQVNSLIKTVLIYNLAEPFRKILTKQMRCIIVAALLVPGNAPE